MLRLVVCAFALTLAANSSTQASQLVTLEDVVRNVLSSHLEIEKQKTRVERSDAIKQQASSQFDWNLAAEGGFRRPRVPGSNENGLLTTETEVNNVYNITVGMEKRFRNGVSIAPGFSYSHNMTENSSDVLAESVTLPHLAVKIPLLRGRGTDATTAKEQEAQEAYNASKLSSERDIAKLLITAIAQYWQSVAAKRNLGSVRRAGKEAAIATETLKKLSEQGELSVLEYQSGVANLNLRRLKIEKSAATWNSTRRKLARLMETGLKTENLPISAEDFPDFSTDTELELDENELVDVAFEHRRDILALEREIKSKRHNLLKSRNDLLPQLDLNLDLDKITVSYAQSLDRNLSKGRKRDSAAELKAYEIELQMLKQAVSDEVFETVQSLQLSFNSYKRALKAYRLLEQIAAATQDKVAQGTVARNEYIVALDKLSDVEHIISSAGADYIIALAKLRLATGTLPIGGENVKTMLNTLLTVPTNG